MPSNPESKKKYAHISHQLRLELIDLVQKENYPLSVASDLLKIKLSTAKLIISKYKSRGYVTKHKSQKDSQDLSFSDSLSKQDKKNTSKTSHQHHRKAKSDVKKQQSPQPIASQNQRNEQKNQEQTPFQATSYGIVPWNGLMFPFVYIWNSPQ